MAILLNIFSGKITGAIEDQKEQSFLSATTNAVKQAYSEGNQVLLTDIEALLDGKLTSAPETVVRTKSGIVPNLSGIKLDPTNGLVVVTHKVSDGGKINLPPIGFTNTTGARLDGKTALVVCTKGGVNQIQKFNLHGLPSGRTIASSQMTFNIHPSEALYIHVFIAENQGLKHRLIDDFEVLLVAKPARTTADFEFFEIPRVRPPIL